MKKACLILCLVFLLPLISSCAKMYEEETAVPGGLQFTDIDLKGSIPLEYGELVAVTSSDTYPGWAQLWFEKEDKTIVMVAVNFSDGQMRPKLTTIPRS